VPIASDSGELIGSLADKLRITGDVLMTAPQSTASS
jgi:hypothetical protein